jgi:L-threonylcarbamoyladenylate synthase
LIQLTIADLIMVMKTDVIKVDPVCPDAETIERAGAIIRAGGLVAFPTETVYGLGANALDSHSVKRIFEVKGRPASNPLIVHVGSAEDARELVQVWPKSAQKLADRFWPGPLTLVLPKAKLIPDEVTAGGPTVAVRVPENVVALALLRAAGLPIAAPSANRSARISPTRAEHVERDLGGLIPLILDSGSTRVGLESTVLDLSSEIPRILRPGMLSKKEIEVVIGSVKLHDHGRGAEPLRSPGMLSRHYSPQTPVELVHEGCSLRTPQPGDRVGYLAIGHGRLQAKREIPLAAFVEMPESPHHYAARLYDELHRLDNENLDLIVIEMPADAPEWVAVRDRLMRAAGAT